MNASSDGGCGRDALERELDALVVRSYRQIAEVLARRESTAMTPARVARICRGAEMKIVRSLLADPVTHARLLAEQRPIDE